MPKAASRTARARSSVEKMSIPLSFRSTNSSTLDLWYTFVVQIRQLSWYKSFRTSMPKAASRTARARSSVEEMSLPLSIRSTNSSTFELTAVQIRQLSLFVVQIRQFWSIRGTNPSTLGERTSMPKAASRTARARSSVEEMRCLSLSLFVVQIRQLWICGTHSWYTSVNFRGTNPSVPPCPRPLHARRARAAASRRCLSLSLFVVHIRQLWNYSWYKFVNLVYSWYKSGNFGLFVVQIRQLWSTNLHAQGRFTHGARAQQRRGDEMPLP